MVWVAAGVAAKAAPALAASMAQQDSAATAAPILRGVRDGDDMDETP